MSLRSWLGMDKTTLDKIKQAAIARGYRFELSADGKEERMIRPDGTVAVIARKGDGD